jgi:hypothetical protein
VEVNAAMRSIVRRDTRERYEEFGSENEKCGEIEHDPHILSDFDHPTSTVMTPG